MWGGGVADISGLKAIDTTGLENGLGLAVQSKLDWYFLNSSSSATADDDAVVAPTTGPGRWFRKTTSSGGSSNYQVKTANYTAVAGDRLIADTFANSWTLTVPSSPSAGDTIEISTTENAPTKPLLLSASKVDGVSLSTTVQIDSQANVRLHYIDSTRGWVTTPSGLVISRYSKEILADNPYLYWRLEDAGSKVAIDRTTNKRHGIYAGDVVPTDGSLTLPSKAATFSGGERIYGPLAPVGLSTFSANFSVSVRFKTTSANRGILDFADTKTDSYGSFTPSIFLDSTGKAVFVLYGSGEQRATSPLAYNDGSWHSLVATHGSGTMRLYVDGMEVATQATTSAQSFSGYWQIGVSKYAAIPYWVGDLDEFAVFHSTLSAARITAHHAAF